MATKPQLIIIIVWLAIACSSCPKSCFCFKSKEVSCTKQQLKDLPKDLDLATNNLDFSFNSLTYISTHTFSLLPKLTHLNLHANQLEGISQGAFSSNLFMQNLNLSRNSMTTLDRYCFTGLQLLLYLDLSNNLLRNVDGAFEGLGQLSKLDLCHNKLKQINKDTFMGLKHLRHLSICHNNIQQIHKDSFWKMDKLRMIVLEGNNLVAVQKMSFMSNYLTYVGLSNCHLSCMPRGLPNSIRYLQLKGNDMTVLKKETFEDCRFVSIVVLDDNAIEEVHEGVFGGMVYLQQIWINRNNLSVINDQIPKNVRKLCLDSNRLEGIPSYNIPPHSRLTILSLKDNYIHKLDEKAFENMGYLEELYLSGNRIKTLTSTSFSSLMRLVILDLSKNPLKYFMGPCFKQLLQLQNLHLSSITSNHPSLDPNAFQGLRNLEMLELNGSPSLVRVLCSSKEVLTAISNVRDLRMENCHLSALDAAFLGHFENLEKFKITSTSWCCDANLIWLKKWLQNNPNKFSFAHENKCRSPLKMKNISILKADFLTSFDAQCHKSANQHFLLLSSKDGKNNEAFKNKTIDSNLYKVNKMLESLERFEFLEQNSSKKNFSQTSRNLDSTLAMTANDRLLFVGEESNTQNDTFELTNQIGEQTTNPLLAMSIVLVVVILASGFIFFFLIIYFLKKGIQLKNRARIIRNKRVKIGSKTIRRDNNFISIGGNSNNLQETDDKNKNEKVFV